MNAKNQVADMPSGIEAPSCWQEPEQLWGIHCADGWAVVVSRNAPWLACCATYQTKDQAELHVLPTGRLDAEVRGSALSEFLEAARCLKAKTPARKATCGVAIFDASGDCIEVIRV